MRTNYNAVLVTAYVIVIAFCLAFLFTLPSCADVSAIYHTATSASITRNPALELTDATKIAQDIATATINTCVETKSYTGVCSPSAIEPIHKALVATRGPRDALLSFAFTHAGKELGASGLYDALVTVKQQLIDTLQLYGIAVPIAASPS